MYWHKYSHLDLLSTNVLEEVLNRGEDDECVCNKLARARLDTHNRIDDKTYHSPLGTWRLMHTCQIDLLASALARARPR